jgi:hypothetical protein
MMNTKIPRRAFLLSALPLSTLWAGRKVVIDERKELPWPVATYVESPVDDIISEDAALLKAYVVPVTLDQPVVMEIDYIADQSGAGKEVPADIGQSVRSVFERIGEPFLTFRTWTSIASSAHGSVLLAPRGPDHPKPPEPSYRVVGVVAGYKETLVRNKNNKFALTFGGGHTSTDIQAQLDKIRAITTLSISLTLERPDTVAVPGTTVDYEIDIAKDERSRDIGLYVGGSGMGLGSKLTVTQSTADMIREAVAMAVIHMMGVAFQVPYYRCSKSFMPNPKLDKTVRTTFAGLADEQIEDCIRRFLFLSGKKVNPSGPMTAADRIVIRQGMSSRGFAEDYEGRIRMAMDLWSGLDYHKAGDIVDDLLVARQRQINQAATERTKETRPQSPAAPDSPSGGADPVAADFGWPPYARFVVLDLSGIADTALRNAVIEVAKTAEGCFEVRAHKNPALIGLRLSSSAVEIEKALKRSRLRIRYGWSTPNRLAVLPAQ